MKITRSARTVSRPDETTELRRAGECDGRGELARRSSADAARATNSWTDIFGTLGVRRLTRDKPAAKNCAKIGRCQPAAHRTSLIRLSDRVHVRLTAVGRIDRPLLSLANVVAASSAFPPFLSPVRLKFDPDTVKPLAGADLHRPPFTKEAVLTDGGVYDNLGLERVWKRCRTILVSNAGRNTAEIGSPTGRWIGQVFRTLSLVQQQAEKSRKRILFGMNNLNQRKVAYWSIETPIAGYGVLDALPMAPDSAATVANMRTRPNPFRPADINLLLQAGYAGADASLRSQKLGEEAEEAERPVN